MPTVQEKMGQTKVAVPMKIKETDKENIHLSRDQYIAKNRKKKEIDAKLALEKVRLEELATKEQADLEKIGSQDSSAGTQEEV